MIEIKKFKGWVYEIESATYNQYYVINESIVGEDWHLGKAIYDSLKKDQTPGEREIKWKLPKNATLSTTKITVTQEDDKDVFSILAGMAGYSHNYHVVILGHGIYPKYETHYDREKNPKQYRNWANDLPERLRKYLTVYLPECPKNITNVLVALDRRVSKFVDNWHLLDDDDQAMFQEHPELSLEYIKSDLTLEEWKKKAKGKIAGLDYNV